MEYPTNQAGGIMEPSPAQSEYLADLSRRGFKITEVTMYSDGIMAVTWQLFPASGRANVRPDGERV